MGLKSNLEFFNQLRIGDLRSALIAGDSSVFKDIPATTPGTVASFREFFALAPAIDILKLFAPHKATALVKILNGIISLADFNQRLGCHLASQPALEPIHAVLCDMLRSGADFATLTRQNPLSIATQALQHACSTPDDDATIFAAGGGRGSRAPPGPPSVPTPRFPRVRSNGMQAARRGRRFRNCCFAFQKDKCNKTVQTCEYQHICSHCGQADHGLSRCPSYPRSNT